MAGRAVKPPSPRDRPHEDGGRDLIVTIFGIILRIGNIREDGTTNDINKAMLNPVRLRIIQELAAVESLTANELCSKLPDVPRTSMYRHIHLLIEAGILRVASERKIRGSLERSLVLDVGKLRSGNTLENATGNALMFLMNRFAGFQRYFSGKKPDPGRDRIFLNNTILMMDDGEFDRFLAELRELLVRYSFEAGGARRPRDISIISSPAEDI